MICEVKAQDAKDKANSIVKLGEERSQLKK